MFSARAQYRKAQLIAKRNPLATQRKDRDTLFASPEGVAGDRHSSYGRRKTQDTLSQDDILLHASNDITASLTRTHNLLSAELQRSQFARETLGQTIMPYTRLSMSMKLIFVCRDFHQRAFWLIRVLFQP